MLEDNFAKKLKRCGINHCDLIATKAQIAFGKAQITDTYGTFIDLYGYGRYRNGRFQYVPIDRFRPLDALIFGADADFSPDDCHILGYDAFGMTMTAWSERHNLVEINMLGYSLSNILLAPGKLGGPPLPPPQSSPPVGREHLTRIILQCGGAVGECWDWMDQPMFDDCAARYGALGFGECYGFFPSLGLTGYVSRSRDSEASFKVSVQARSEILPRAERQSPPYRRNHH